MLFTYRQRCFNYLQRKRLHSFGKVFLNNMREQFFELNGSVFDEIFQLLFLVLNTLQLILVAALFDVLDITCSGISICTADSIDSLFCH